MKVALNYAAFICFYSKENQKNWGLEFDYEIIS
jgi:hypothetical protein